MLEIYYFSMLHFSWKVNFMKKMYCIILVIMCMAFISCSPNRLNSKADEILISYECIDVSLIQLIANPEEYHGKFIRVIGVGNLEFEGNAVYVNKDDYKYNVFKNGVWIEFGENSLKYEDAVKYNGKYVIIEGIFNSEEKGHFGMWSGTIEKINRYDLWEER